MKICPVCGSPVRKSQLLTRHKVEREIRRHPERGNSWIAELVGASAQTVDLVRLQMESKGEIKKYDYFETRNGRRYPRKCKVASQ